MKNNDNIVVTGTSAISALGLTIDKAINKLKNSQKGNIQNNCFKIPEKDINTVQSLYNSGEISIDMAVYSVAGALENAKIKKKEIPDDTIVIYSSSKGGVDSLLKACKSEVNMGNNFFNYLPSSALSHVCSYIGKNLSAMNLVSACSTGLYSIIEAYHAVKRGHSLAIAGTTESSLNPLIISAFANMKALTKDKIMPFDKKRNGFIMGQGAGCLILESEQRAKKRDANILCKITGFGRFSDTFHVTALDEAGEVIAMAIEKALNGNLNVDWINSHGTGTKINDLAEYNAFKKIWKNDLKNIPVNSLKPYFGHLLGASSTVETIYAIHCMNEGFIPANLNLNEPEFDLNLSTQTVYKDINRFIKLSHGFGGHIGSLVLEK